MSSQTRSTHLHKPVLAILAALMLGASQQSLHADIIQITGTAVGDAANLAGTGPILDFTLTINISGLPIPDDPNLNTWISGTVVGFQATVTNAVSLTGISALPIPSRDSGWVGVSYFPDGAELDFSTLDSKSKVSSYGFLELPDDWTGTAPVRLFNFGGDSSELYVNLQFPGDPLDTGSYVFYLQDDESHILSSATPESNMFGPIALAAGLVGTFRRTRKIGG